MPDAEREALSINRGTLVLALERGTLVVASEDDRVVIWLSGEQDSSNSEDLHDACAAVLSGERDLAIDVGNVEFMSVATVNVIVSVSELLRVRNHRLSVQSSTSAIRRLFDLCAASDLIGSPTSGTGALNSWVQVPTTIRESHDPSERTSEASALGAPIGGDGP